MVLFVLFITVTIFFLSQAMGVYLGYEPGGFGIVGLAFIISGLMSLGSYYYSDKIVLAISQAFATGRDPDHAVICVTTGILQKLDRTELEGVLAHEISHIVNYDIRLMSIVSILVGTVALMADWFFRMRWYGGGDRDRDKGQLGAILMLLGIIFAILSPIIARLIQLAISRRREFMADAGSVSITRQPTGLISALNKISADHEPLEAANKATAHLYIVNPFKDKVRSGARWFSGLFNTHPPLEERIVVLSKMV